MVHKGSSLSVLIPSTNTSALTVSGGVSVGRLYIEQTLQRGVWEHSFKINKRYMTTTRTIQALLIPQILWFWNKQ
jgi:hypothetical protein